MAKVKETDIQMAICDYLALKKHFFWRQNSVPVFSEGRFRAMSKYAKNGVPDIIVVKDGWFIGLEVKTQQGRISSAQEAFEKGVKEAGGEYYIVRSIEDVQDIGL